jgi:hypothetical protein
MLRLDMVRSPSSMRSSMHCPWAGLPALPKTMSDQERLGSGIGEPVRCVGSATETSAEAGLSGTAAGVPALVLDDLAV